MYILRFIFFLSVGLVSFNLSSQEVTEILQKVDRNMSAESRITHSEMTIHGRRSSRTIESKSYTQGDSDAMTEYLAPAREKGVKMLKLDKKLWIYSPETDRTILLSGHMLRQSVLGSDLSYEDMMEDRTLLDVYDAEIIKEEKIDDRKTWKIRLTAKVEDINYTSKVIWIDKKTYTPVREESYAKRGTLLKTVTFHDIQKQGNKWFPMKMIYKDELKRGKGTEFKVLDIEFNKPIPDYIMSKSILKK